MTPLLPVTLVPMKVVPWKFDVETLAVVAAPLSSTRLECVRRLSEVFQLLTGTAPAVWLGDNSKVPGPLSAAQSIPMTLAPQVGVKPTSAKANAASEIKTLRWMLPMIIFSQERCL